MDPRQVVSAEAASLQSFASCDPETLAQWAAECLRDGLYRPDGMAQYIFRQPDLISDMVYVPAVAWVLRANYKGARRVWQGFTRPDLRRRGICRRLYRETLTLALENPMPAESAPSFGHMPTEFPAESAARIGRAILNRAFSLSLLGDLYDVLGYGLRQLIGDGGDDKPTFGAAVDGQLTHDQMAELLVKAGEAKPEFAAGLDADEPTVAGAIPWASVVPLLLQLVLKIALGKNKP